MANRLQRYSATSLQCNHKPECALLNYSQATLQAYPKILRIAFPVIRLLRHSLSMIISVGKFIDYFSEYPVRGFYLEETMASDIVCTITPSREPLVHKEWVIPGTHINAIGADTEGKEELEPSILKESTLVVDDLSQASTAGEINVPLKKELISIDDVHATLGEIIIGEKQGRKDRKAVTVFDCTGVGIEDIAVARLVYERAQQAGSYLSLNLVEG